METVGDAGAGSQEIASPGMTPGSAAGRGLPALVTPQGCDGPLRRGGVRLGEVNETAQMQSGYYLYSCVNTSFCLGLE